ncbi:MAG TPA: inositol monophosphatase family protein [Thermoleophilaceae bacterium]|nr:inositol monophosphatase family protein [Thermoleophilaceae bacterium]
MTADVELAERAARRAGEVLLAYFGRPPEGLDSKSSRTDPVSDADREAERAIRELLSAERPDDGLLAEEGSRTEARNGRCWIVDPLDGTVNFLYGFPVWAVSVALEDEDGLAVGVVHDPGRGETFRAARGAGAELDGRPLRVGNRSELRAALVATGFSYDRERRAAQAEMVARLLPRVRDIRRAGAAALDLAWLAAGRVDGFLEHGLKSWDWAAGRLLVEEAGGVVEPLPGDPPGLAAAGTPELLGALVEHAGALRAPLARSASRAGGCGELGSL